MHPRSFLALLAFPVLAAHAGDKLPGLYFSHADWELACDNTGTCRAAGYQADSDQPAVSVLLTRKAGPGQAVTGQLLLGQLGDAAVSTPLTLALMIDGAKAGTVSAGDAPAQLSAQSVTALLGALRRTATIEWTKGAQRWRLSGTGAAAVLLKMDEFQGRVGTRGALHRPGTQSEQRVLQAVPAPVVKAVPWAATLAADSARYSGQQAGALRLALRATVAGGDDLCPDLLEDDAGDRPLSVWRLDAQRLLVSTRCWLGSYNVGNGFWVIDGTPGFNPVRVTASGSDVDRASIVAEHKSRGIGDCRSSDAWTWDGRRFVHTASSTTGLCKMVDAGGSWELPRIVTEVR